MNKDESEPTEDFPDPWLGHKDWTSRRDDEPVYLRRFVAFIDILGFRSIVRRTEIDRDLASRIRYILSTIKEQAAVSRAVHSRRHQGISRLCCAPNVQGSIL